MGTAPYGNPSEIDAFFANKHPGDQVTKAEIFGLKSFGGLSMPQKRKVLSHYEGLGVLVHGEGGAFYYKQTPAPKTRPEVYTTNIPVRGPGAAGRPHIPSISYTDHELVDRPGERYPPEIPALETDNTPVTNSPRRPEPVTYKFFDPNPRIFRGTVVSEAGYSLETDKRQRAGVEVLLPDGSTKFGLVTVSYDTTDSWLFRGSRSLDFRERIVGSVGSQMKTGQLVLVRHTGEFTGKSGRPTWTFEPLFYITEEDQAKLNGEKIATRLDGDRILWLPVVEQGRPKLGVSDGVGYIGTELMPVYIEGAETKLWEILPEAQARLIRPRGYMSKQFYVGEIPMTPEAKAERELTKAEHAVGLLRQNVDSMNLVEALGGLGEAPSAEKTYIITLGALKHARNAGMEQEAVKKRDEARRVVSRLVAAHGLGQREQEIMEGLYREGTATHQQLAKEWPALVESYLDAMERSGNLVLYPSDRPEAVQRRKQMARQELVFPPSSYRISRLGIFDPNVIKQMRESAASQNYLSGVDTAFDIGSRKVETAHDWRGHFSIQDISSTSQRVIDESAFWQIVRESFKGSTAQSIWDAIFNRFERWQIRPEETPLRRRFMQPYIDLVQQHIA